MKARAAVPLFGKSRRRSWQEMPINPDAVGSESEPTEASWTSKDALLYAVGVGAGTEELAFTTENSMDVDQRVLPTFPVVIGWGMGTPLGKIGDINPAMIVHGQQAVTLHKEIPVDGTATLRSRIAGIWDKGKAAVVETETTATDKADGQPLYTSMSSIFIRGEGGWGGDRGPSGPRNVPPEREPDHTVSYETLPTQALIYRLSGDRNPLHSDPSFAKLAGFETPILHGLCTYGFTGRALLHTLADSDPARFTHMEGRFAAPVYPGDTLTVNMWTTADGEAVFTTARQDGTIVIDQGLCRYRS
jgi:acyl dehydratase